MLENLFGPETVVGAAGAGIAVLPLVLKALRHVPRVVATARDLVDEIGRIYNSPELRGVLMPLFVKADNLTEALAKLAKAFGRRGLARRLSDAIVLDRDK